MSPKMSTMDLTSSAERILARPMPEPYPSLVQLPVDTSPEERRLLVMLQLQEHVMRPLAILQGYLSMMADGTLQDWGQVLPVLMATAQELSDRLRQVLTYVPQTWFPADLVNMAREVNEHGTKPANGLRGTRKNSTGRRKAGVAGSAELR